MKPRDRAVLLDRLRKAETLHARATFAGERAAAGEAVKRLRARLFVKVELPRVNVKLTEWEFVFEHSMRPVSNWKTYSDGRKRARQQWLDLPSKDVPDSWYANQVAHK